jgi:segregation and condensation protein B
MRKPFTNLAEHLGSPAAAVRQPWAHAVATRRSPPPAPARPLPPAESPAPAKSQAEKLARLEAALFLAREALSTRKLAELADLADGTEARALVRELTRRLRRRGSAFLPVEVAHGVLLMTRPQLADWLARWQPPDEELRLSAPALETLAVVAYRQPATRAGVEAIRGVQCGEILRVLMERDLLRIVGRSEELGRPFLYGTTRRFLQVFGLGRLEQLPPVDQIRNATATTTNVA